MARKVILDVDPGIDGAVALAMALFDPRLDVVAVTAVGGNVSASQATRNVQAIIEQLDPPRWPRIGAASEPERAPITDRRDLHGPDGLGGANFVTAELHHRHSSEKVLTDELRSSPDQVTILTLGPLTNIAAVLRRDPGLAGQIGHLMMSGGAVRVSGDVTPTAEFGIFCDPMSARMAFRSRATKTLVPLDVTQQVAFTYGHLDQFPDESSRVGRLLRKVLPFAFRAHHQRLGLEHIFLPDAVTVAALQHPELFQVQSLGGDVETTGELTAGSTVFDRRVSPEWRGNMEVALEIDPMAIMDVVLRSLAEAAKQTRD